mmetsp:Transcript_6766/g.20530  ORF Transcript_6766/g.20530 Transcript_6766/m.20530 type:complete len:125 (+) Transcript_6766:977-1351(+)
MSKFCLLIAHGGPAADTPTSLMGTAHGSLVSHCDKYQSTIVTVVSAALGREHEPCRRAYVSIRLAHLIHVDSCARRLDQNSQSDERSFFASASDSSSSVLTACMATAFSSHDLAVFLSLRAMQH